ncbi:hypothetical protein M2448_001253 [Dysgonomonas sp. PF1-14]|nr:hypothetical protein [Dysgonomonas sp. PF1-14]MDH6397180.1 hypothetical protein [Dysgonomonas sp. PF1-23]
MYEKLDNLSKRNTIILFLSFFLFSAILYSYAVCTMGSNIILDELY